MVIITFEYKIAVCIYSQRDSQLVKQSHHNVYIGSPRFCAYQGTTKLQGNTIFIHLFINVRLVVTHTHVFYVCVCHIYANKRRS